MNTKPFLASLLFTLAGLCLFSKVNAQQNLTVVYDIIIQKNKQSTGIEETYNGGTKSVFTNGKKGRIRLVSLMRIQSIFFDYGTELKKATVIKESGKSKYLFKLTAAEWKLYNKKYDSLVCDTSFTDSADIKGYACRKAVIRLEDEKQVTVFYTDSIKMNNAVIEPLFRFIKGTVLQYDVKTRKGTISFKASEISTGNIDPKIFVLPSKGAVIKKYNANKKAVKDTEVLVEEDE
jgi:hypothetical protein